MGGMNTLVPKSHMSASPKNTNHGLNKLNCLFLQDNIKAENSLSQCQVKFFNTLSQSFHNV